MSIFTSANRRFWNSHLGALTVRAFIRLTRNAVFSPRTAGLMSLDEMRIRARLATPKTKGSPPSPKLHLGSGTRIIPGWTNVDVVGGDLTLDLAGEPLPWVDGVFDVTVSQHLIEHIELFSELLPLLAELRRVSRDGAEIWLATPDMAKVCRSYVETGGSDLLEDFIPRFPTLIPWRPIPSHIVNSVFHQEGEHKNLYDFELLRWALEGAGFGDCQRVNESDLLAKYADFPLRDDNYHSLYVRAIAGAAPQKR